jgi:hypothetical protein
MHGIMARTWANSGLTCRSWKRQLTKDDRARLQKSGQGVTVRYIDGAGQARVHGGPRLRSTQAYTRAFAKAVFTLHSKYTLKINLKSVNRRICRCAEINVDTITDNWAHADWGAIACFLERRAAKNATINASND